MKNRLIIFTIFILVLGCKGSGNQTPIKIYGELFSIMHEGERDGQVSLVEILQDDHVYAVGAMEGLLGEVIIWDNQVLINRATKGENPTIQTVIHEKDSALLLVTAQIEKWQNLELKESASMSSIDAVIKKYANNNGINTHKPFPFLIDGVFEFVEWHIIDAPEPGGSHDEHMASSWSRKDYKINGKILGFYSEHHQTIFTHYSSFTHMHVLFEKENLSGHVDDINIERQWILSVPEIH
jgi:acetolactate decarboxylase